MAGKNRTPHTSGGSQTPTVKRKEEEVRSGGFELVLQLLICYFLWQHEALRSSEKQPCGLCLDTEPNRNITPSSPLQVKSGTIFDNFLITDDPKLAEEVGNETWGKTKVRP